MYIISYQFVQKYLVFPNVFESSGDLFPAIVVPISKALNLGELYSGETRTKSNVVPRTRDSMFTSLIRPVNSRNVASILRKRKMACYHCYINIIILTQIIFIFFILIKLQNTNKIINNVMLSEFMNTTFK